LIDPGTIAKLELGRVLTEVQKYSLTEGGKRRIFSLEVLTDLSKIRAELALVTELKQLLEGEGDLPLDPLGDVTKTIRRCAIIGSVLTPKELLEVARLLHASRALRGYLSTHRINAILVWELAEGLFTSRVIEYNIGQAIDPSGEIRSEASKELRSIRRAIIDRHETLRTRLHRILKDISDHGLAQEDIVTTREGRMVIPVKSEHQRRVPGFVHSASASGATVFVEPTETLELNNEITDLQFRERREIDRILSELSGQVREAHEQILAAAEVIETIDAIHARARYSIASISAQPLISADGRLVVRSARHPLLLLSHGMDGTVPIDLELGGDLRTLVISGPNAGGKSVTMKTVGLLTLMAQAGLHIPAAADTELRMFRNVFVDIGDDQSIENDLSTFSSHLKTLRTILSDADGDSLVLLDEIGTGTDPTEGGALAAAVLEDLTRRGSITIATTHHGALKVFAHQSEGITNGAMEFDRETLKPTYRFRAGVPGSSYALEMAERLSLDRGILRRAREMQGETRSSLESLLGELEAAVQRHRTEEGVLAQERKRLGDLTAEYEEKMRGVKSELAETKRKARLEAKEIVDGANALVERSIREIREESAGKEVVRRVREEVESAKHQLKENLENEQPERNVADIPIGQGMQVVLSPGGTPGTVEEVDPGKGTAFVLFGAVRMKVRLDELMAWTGSTPPGHRVDIPTPRIDHPVSTEIDVRGLNGDEAVEQVDRFLDSAVLAGLHRIDVIHGKGTGVLRKRVSEFLSQDTRVGSFRLGEWNEGGGGATVVELL